MNDTGRVGARIGFWASIAAAGETAIFAISLIAGLAVNLGPTLSYVASILLAPTIVCVMAAACIRSRGSRAPFGLMALVCAVLYAPLSMSTYFIQLAVVGGNPLGLSNDLLRLIAFVPGSPIFAIDMLGYSFLCLSTLWVAFCLDDASDKALRLLCIIHGFLLVPTAAAPLMSRMYLSGSGQASTAGSWVNLFWCAVFIPIAVLFAASFRRQSGTRVQDSSNVPDEP